MKKLILILAILFFAIGSAKGVEPMFNYIDDDWLQPMTQDMSDFWTMAGLQETGMNYYSAAGGENYWERFNPNNPRYQAWFGVYVVDNFEFKEEWTKRSRKTNSIKRAIALTIADQTAWGVYFSNPNPEPSLIENSVLYYLGCDSWYNVKYVLNASSDLGGEYVPYLPFCPDYALYSDLVEPYQPLKLHCKIKIKYFPDVDKFVVIYSAIAEWQLKDGTWKYPTCLIRKEIRKMMKNVEF